MKEDQVPSQHVPRIRSFVAVNLPVGVVQKVGELQNQLRQRASQAGLKVGWVPLTSMHITIKFLAEIPEESVHAVRDLLRERLIDRPAIWARVHGTGAFPSRQRPRVLWVGVQTEEDQLVRLAAEVDGWLEELGFTPEKRAFHPHLTLGRVKAGAADVLEGLEEVDFGECPIGQVVLYRSVLRRQGAEYSPIAQIPLRAVPRPAGTRSEAPAPWAEAGAESAALEPALPEEPEPFEPED